MAKAWKIEGLKSQKSYRKNASIILPIKIAEVYSWDKYIDDPQNVEGLHNMRISIKRLRYSMEFFSVNYGKKFGELIQVWVDLQRLLGDIHDCDVGQDVLIDYLEDPSQRDNEGVNVIGINTLILRYRQTRQERYQEFLTYWTSLQKKDFKGNLLGIIKKSN